MNTTETATTTKRVIRQKRNKYVTCACFECKRRKIKCNGQQPCERCDHLTLDCEYPPEPGTRKRRKKSSVSHSVEERPPPPPQVKKPVSPVSPKMEDEVKLFGISFQDARHLLEVYDAEVNCMYPMFHEGELTEKYEELWKTRDALTEGDKTSLIVKLSIANGSVIANRCLNVGKTMFEDASNQVMRTVVKGVQVSLSDLICLLLIHQYQYHCDMGTVPYRTVGFASVIAYELGLHKYEDLESKTHLSQLEKEYHRLIFWCLYVMDRRLAVYTKKPCILQEDDIDQKMPNYYVFTNMPYASENDLYRAMHLNYMIYYSQIVGKFKTSNSHSEKSIGKFEAMLKNWQASLPPELKLHDEKSQSPPHFSRKLKSILYLKSNLMLLHLYSSTKLSSYPQQAVNAARQCIRELARLYFNTGLYVSCEIQYNHFLVSALDVLYSATHAEPKKYSQTCAEDLNLALKLVNLVLKRPPSEQHGSIWRLVGSFAQKLGLDKVNAASDQPQQALLDENDSPNSNHSDFWQQLYFQPSASMANDPQRTHAPNTDYEFSKNEILTIFNQLYEDSTSSPPNADTFNQDVQHLRFFEPLDTSTQQEIPDEETLANTLGEIFKT